MPAATRYRIAPLDVHAHLFLVRCTIDDPAPGGQRFTLPTWVPGSYLVREFARHFVAVRAEANSIAVPIAKEAKDTWRAAPCTGPLTVIAEVYAFDLSVRAAYLDARRGYFNGATMFLCPEGRADAPCEVEIVKPEFAGASEWRVATTLSPRAPRRSASGRTALRATTSATRGSALLHERPGRYNFTAGFSV